MAPCLVIASLLALSVDYTDGVASKDRLWLRNREHALVVYDRASGKSSVAAEHVVAMDRSADGGVIVLIEVAADSASKRTTYEMRDVAPLATIVSRFDLTDDRALAIIVGSGPTTVVTAKTVMTLEKGSWAATRLTAELRPGDVQRGVQTKDGVLLGLDGGGLRTINRMTGMSREVKVGDATLTGLTALMVDSTKPECALASVAQSQEGRGYVTRVCGEQTEIIYSKANKDGTTSPILGLVAADKGWVGIGGGKLLRSKDGKVKESAPPKPKAWKGLTASFSPPELILVQVAGREAPLVVPVYK